MYLNKTKFATTKHKPNSKNTVFTKKNLAKTYKFTHLFESKSPKIDSKYTS